MINMHIQIRTMELAYWQTHSLWHDSLIPDTDFLYTYMYYGIIRYACLEHFDIYNSQQPVVYS